MIKYIIYRIEIDTIVILYFLNNTIDHDSNYTEKVYILKYV